MDFFRTWILGVTAAAILGTAAVAIAPRGGSGRIVKLCTALALAFAIIRPLIGFRAADGLAAFSTEDYQMEDISAVGRELTARIIAGQSAAYIVSKAQALGLRVEAEVECRDGTYEAAPYAVTVRCERPEHAKNALRDVIYDDLAIPPERQRYVE